MSMAHKCYLFTINNLGLAALTALIKSLFHA